MQQEIIYEDLPIGETYGPYELLMDEKLIKEYCEDHKDYNPIYLKDSPFGGPVVPLSYKASLQCQYAMHTKYDMHATVPAKSEQEYLYPPRVGSTLITNAMLKAKYLKRGLEYLVVESWTTDQNGVKVRHGLEHLLIGLKKRHGNITEGYDDVKDYVFQKKYKPDGKAYTVKGNLTIGDEIPSLTKIAWQRALHEKVFLSDSIHDDKYTRAHGYAGPLVSGYILNEYMCQMLLEFFGPYWLKGGIISQDFINGGVQEGDRLVCHGKIIGMSEEPDGIRLYLDIWMVKGQDTKILIGKATGVVRK
ncbi:MAG: MaoC family dehydratase [Dehalococcoidales bacterium]|nr:MaoC family dehydratase [Dehalococcoidales bacterium]